jgi:hypothetical protein
MAMRKAPFWMRTKIDGKTLRLLIPWWGAPFAVFTWLRNKLRRRDPVAIYFRDNTRPRE